MSASPELPKNPSAGAPGIGLGASSVSRIGRELVRYMLAVIFPDAGRRHSGCPRARISAETASSDAPAVARKCTITRVEMAGTLRMSILFDFVYGADAN